MKKDTNKNDFSELRMRAESFLSTKLEQKNLFEEDIQKLVHELSTYQIELELQNEDLRHTQQELEKSKCRYADLYDFAPVGYITVSDQGLILETNLTAGDMLGVARGQLLGQRFADFIVTEDQDQFYLHRKKLLETGLQQSYELRLKKQDGPFFYAQIETVLHTNDDSIPPEQFRVTITDVSIRKEADLAQLLHLKNRYRAIVMDQTELICRFDLQGKMTFVNDAYCRYFGVDYQDILGTNFLPNIYEADLPLVKDQFKTLTLNQPNKTIEHRVYLPDGTIRWQQWCGRALYDQEGKIIEYQAVGRDITKRKNAEEKLQKEARLRQLFLDALPCIAMLLTYNTRLIIASNKAAAKIGAIPGQRCYTALLQRETPCPWCQAPNLWPESEPMNGQFWAHGIYWDAFWIPVDDDLYLHYLFDITEKQKDKEALKKVNDELEQRVIERTQELQQSHAQLLHSEKLAAVGNLSASIAHEFNNPLQSVMTIIKGIKQFVALEEQEQELITLALQECNRMKNLITDLRDFFLPTSGESTRVDLRATIEALLLISKKDFHTRKIRIVKRYGDNVPYIMAVSDQIKQVFLNLLNNAADACEGGGEITIITETIGKENIAVHIKDNGKGISSANIGHIFEPFFTTKQALKGTGLGLSVSYGIIKKHGGRIDVQSTPGQGSAFSVFLPVKSVVNE